MVWYSDLFKNFPDKQKLREFSIIKPALQEILKELFWAGKTRKGKDLHKINSNNKENGNKFIHIYNYLNSKWIKCINQKTLRGDENMCIYALPFTTWLYLTPHKLYIITYIIRLIMFPLWLAIIIIFLFFVWQLIMKTDKYFYYCNYIGIIHLMSLYHNWSTENNRILHH